MDSSQTTLIAAQQNVLAAVNNQIAQLNAAMQADYMVAFNNWAQRVLAYQAPNANPPQPPNGYVVGYFLDSTDPLGQTKWAYPVIGTQPVCSMPALPVLAPTVTPSPAYTGEPIVGTKQNVPPGDTFPVGIKITDAQGGVWQKQASNTPFGTATWYERTA